MSKHQVLPSERCWPIMHKLPMQRGCQAGNPHHEPAVTILLALFSALLYFLRLALLKSLLPGLCEAKWEYHTSGSGAARGCQKTIHIPDQGVYCE